jgi:predicted acetyltransferase
MNLRLRPLRLDDEPAFIAAHTSMAADHFRFGLAYDAGMSWSAYLDRLEAWRLGIDQPDDSVPGTFLVAEIEGVIVGRTSIRHELNEFLAREGGHIGYCVLAEHRRRGYATEILRQSLVVARAVGVQRVLICCDDDNVGSRWVIERCGGVFDSVVDNGAGDPATRRYWIN